MSVAHKTNAARILDSLGIAYELREYEVDPDDLTAASVARKIGMDAATVFKTLLVKTDASAAFAVVPGDAELALKKFAQVEGSRKVMLMPLAQVEPLTGYIRGGVTVLGAKKPFPVFVDESLHNFDRISVSAGARGLQIIMTPFDYLTAIERATGNAPAVAAISQPMREAR